MSMSMLGCVSAGQHAVNLKSDLGCASIVRDHPQPHEPGPIVWMTCELGCGEKGRDFHGQVLREVGGGSKPGSHLGVFRCTTQVTLFFVVGLNRRFTAAWLSTHGVRR